ncbi:LamG-like jellyroll fold domain-containing protein, partial [Arachidicoccus sp.]|uniref:LamG-like jellyroll fold domain-containing protein n=1 Tax=Arachidicoccus sp. TaxID=1872624 RepID=UPI003D1CE447
MKKKLVSKIFNLEKFAVAVIVMCLGMAIPTACNKPFTNIVQNSRDSSGLSNYIDSSVANGENRKVLYIIVDGATGSAIENITPPNIYKLASSSVYTFNGITSKIPADSSLEGDWTSLLTGVSPIKSKVYNSFDSSQIALYPTLISRIKAIQPKARIVTFGASQTFSDELTTGADISKTFTADAAVSDAVDQNLTQDSAKLVIAQFNDPYAAGMQFGFDPDIAQYRDAIINTDNYIGKAITTIKNRPNYNKEDWFIIIASTVSGTNALPPDVGIGGALDFTYYGQPQRNSFILFNELNGRFSPRYIQRPGSTAGTSPYDVTAFRLVGNWQNSSTSPSQQILIPDPANKYSCPFGDSMTVEAKVKFNSLKQVNYMTFFGKATSGIGIGWAFFRTPSSFPNMNFSVGNGAIRKEISINGIQDTKWHTIAVTFRWTANKTIFVRGYLDGVLTVSQESGADPAKIPAAINNAGNPLILGWFSGPGGSGVPTNLDMYITDVRIWNTE